MRKWTHSTLVKGITGIFGVTKMIANGTFSPDLTWSLTTLPWVSPFHNLSHALTSWQLISHTFSQSQTPKTFWRYSHLLPGKISIDSQLNPKKTLSFPVWLHSATICADLSLLFLFFKMTAMWCLLLQLLSHTCNYVTSNTHETHWKSFHLKIWDISQLFTHLPQITVLQHHRLQITILQHHSFTVAIVQD